MRKIAYFLLYAIFLVITAEFGLRIGAHFKYRTPILDVRRFLSDPLLVWKLNPGYHGPVAQLTYGRINKQGFLGKELEEPKGSDLTRIVIVGGSVIFGIGSSKMEGNCCHQLQRMLDLIPGPNRYEVLNAGIPGYSSWHGRNFVEHRLARLRPDLVIFAFGWNDCLRDVMEDNDLSDPRWQHRILEHGPTFFYGGTAMGYTLRPFINRLTSKLGLYPNLERSNKPRISRVSLQDFRANLEAVQDWCQVHSVRLILMTEPEGSPTSGTWPETLYQHRLYLAAIREVARESQLPLADAAAVFGTMNCSLLFRDQERDALHPNDRGQEVMAQVIYGTLELAGYLNPD